MQNASSRKRKNPAMSVKGCMLGIRRKYFRVSMQDLAVPSRTEAFLHKRKIPHFLVDFTKI